MSSTPSVSIGSTAVPPFKDTVERTISFTISHASHGIAKNELRKANKGSSACIADDIMFVHLTIM